MDKYRELQEKFSQYIFDSTDNQEADVYKLQKNNQDEILNFIAKILLIYTIKDTSLSLGDRDKQALKDKLNLLISTFAKKEFNSEKELIKNMLLQATEDKYYSNAFLFEIDYNFKLQKLSNEQIEKVVNKSVEGKIWSDRLWDNKKVLETNLKTEIERFLQGKTNVNEIEKAVKNKFNQNAFNSHRLVQTEVAKCQSVSNDVFAENHGIEWQLYSATLDLKTSGLCRGLDGKKYRVDDLNKRIPGVNTHPFCRSCLINIPSIDWTPTIRKDNLTKENIDYHSYEEWYDKNVKGVLDNGLDNNNKELKISGKTLKHANEGEFTNPKNPKKVKPNEIRFKSGGHGEDNINLLQKRGIEYNIVKEYSNGVRIGNVPNHKVKEKRIGTKQAWFAKEWTQKDIKKAAEYVSNIKEKDKYILEYNKDLNGNIISIFKFSNYKGVTIGICYDVKLKRITTIFPDETQRLLGGE
ncbi:MAG: minor capsid protein [Clostridiaceae bacterium]